MVFVSALTAAKFNAWHKAIFAFSASGLLFMTSVVRPSAILMIPRSGIHLDTSYTFHVNASETSLFLTHMNDSYHVSM